MNVTDDHRGAEAGEVEVEVETEIQISEETATGSTIHIYLLMYYILFDMKDFRFAFAFNKWFS
jgi:hypothetical protein